MSLFKTKRGAIKALFSGVPYNMVMYLNKPEAKTNMFKFIRKRPISTEQGETTLAEQPLEVVEVSDKPARTEKIDKTKDRRILEAVSNFRSAQKGHKKEPVITDKK